MKLTMEAEDTLAGFTGKFNSGKLDRVAVGYASYAVLNLGGASLLRGPDTGVVIFDCRIEGNGPDESRVDLRGRAVDGIRKGGDGVWRQLFDFPFGATTA